jgi:hypothetical protein
MEGCPFPERPSCRVETSQGSNTIENAAHPMPSIDWTAGVCSLSLREYAILTTPRFASDFPTFGQRARAPRSLGDPGTPLQCSTVGSR